MNIVLMCIGVGIGLYVGYVVSKKSSEKHTLNLKSDGKSKIEKEEKKQNCETDSASKQNETISSEENLPFLDIVKNGDINIKIIGFETEIVGINIGELDTEILIKPGTIISKKTLDLKMNNGILEVSAATESENTLTAYMLNNDDLSAVQIINKESNGELYLESLKLNKLIVDNVSETNVYIDNLSINYMMTSRTHNQGDIVIEKMKKASHLDIANTYKGTGTTVINDQSNINNITYNSKK